MRIGRQELVLSVILLLAVMGLALMTTGYTFRGKPKSKQQCGYLNLI